MSDVESKHGIKSDKIQVQIYNVRCLLKIVGLSFLISKIGFTLIGPKLSTPVVKNSCVINFVKKGVEGYLYDGPSTSKQNVCTDKPNISEAVRSTLIL